MNIKFLLFYSENNRIKSIEPGSLSSGFLRNAQIFNIKESSELINARAAAYMDVYAFKNYHKTRKQKRENNYHAHSPFSCKKCCFKRFIRPFVASFVHQNKLPFSRMLSNFSLSETAPTLVTGQPLPIGTTSRTTGLPTTGQTSLRCSTTTASQLTMLLLTHGLIPTVQKPFSPPRSTQITPTTRALLVALAVTRIRIQSEHRPCSSSKVQLQETSYLTPRNTLRSRSSRNKRASINEKEAFTALQIWPHQPLTSLTRILELLSLSTKASITSAKCLRL